MVAFLYGLVAYLMFVVSFLYAVGFLGNFAVPKSIDSGAVGPWGTAVVVDVLLLGLFGIQHSVMARPWFKHWWTKIVPHHIERSTFVLLTNLVLFLLYWQWRPIPESLWDVSNSAARAVIWVLYFAGCGLVLYSSFVIDHFDLFGMRQVYLHLKKRPYTHPPFVVRSLYKWIRHPLMVGFFIFFWAAPTMSLGRLLFASVASLYIIIAVRIEEHDLLNFLGEPYREYRSRTGMFVPSFSSKRSAGSSE